MSTSQGEATGIAAAQAAQMPTADVRRVDVAKVQNRMREQGAFMPEQRSAG